MKDRRSGIKFLVDSGADVSVIPVNSKRGESTNFKLYAANGTEIPTFGTTVLNIDLGLRRIFEWPFFIAKTSKGILGADFLRKFDLLIDLKNKKLIDAKTKLTVSAAIDKISREEEALSSLMAENKFSDILKQYPDLTIPNLTPSNVKHNVRHYLNTSSGPPVFSKSRRLNPQLLQIAKKEFQFL